MCKLVYLTGPDVFLPNARQIGAGKRAICARHGLVGVYPDDEEHAPDPTLTRPIFAHSNDAQPFVDRVAAFSGDTLRRLPIGEHEDSDGMAIEPFGPHDNLTLTGAIADRCLITASVAPAERYTVLWTDERCVERAAAQPVR